MKPVNDLLTGCLNGEQRDQKALYENYYGYAIRIVFRYIYHYDQARDTVNDGFVKIFNKLASFSFEKTTNIERSFMAWVKTIMIHTAIDRLRKDNFITEVGLVNEGLWIEDPSNTADENILYKEIIKEIKRLPPTYRTVFNMFVIDGYSHHEIATHLDIAVGTSKSNLSKARGLLQIFIKKAAQEKICYM